MNTALIMIFLSPFTAWLVLAYALYDGLKKRPRRPLDAIDKCLLALSALSVVSGVLNGDWLSIGGAFVFIGFVYFNRWLKAHLTSKDKVEKLLERFWHLGLLTGGIGVLEKAASIFIDMSWFPKLFFNPTYYPTAESYRIMSTFGNPNIAADWFAILALLSFYFMEKGRKHYKAGAILFVANLMFTGSKGALVAFVVSIIFYCVLKKSKQLWHYLSGVMVFIGITLTVSFDLFDSINLRGEIWRRCLQMIHEKPIFGSGFYGIYQRMGEPHAHNIFISITTSLGVAGLIAGIALSLFCLKDGIHIVRHKVPMSRLLLSVMAVLFIHGLVDFTLLAPQTSVLFFGTMQLMRLLSEQTSSEKARVYRLKKTDLSHYTWHAYKEGNREIY